MAHIPPAPARSPQSLLDELADDGQLRHVHRRVARAERRAPWPRWTHPELQRALADSGVAAPWSHQVAAAELAAAGHHVVLATGTASGKSLAYQLPALTSILEGRQAPTARGATVLYVAPTKALARDQLRALSALGLAGVRVATYDGDTDREERTWVRSHAHVVLTNPDMLHHSVLPGHQAWAAFLKALRYVVVDESHVYRGVFGSHVANVLRRLRRITDSYGATPTYVLASATSADPAGGAGRLLGVPVACVDDDGSPHGGVTVALWEPPLRAGGAPDAPPVRRAALVEAARITAVLADSGTQTLTFARSRRGAEAVAAIARGNVTRVVGDQIAAYRGGYLPEERRELERGLRDGTLRAVATTNALELGVDITGVDAVVIAGWPGTRASLWQQIGRGGRAGDESLGVFVARDDPLDTYLVHHPDAVFGATLEATVLDPDNPYVIRPHLAAAAAEIPLQESDINMFGPAAAEAVGSLVDAGLLRRRPTGWFWTSRSRAGDLADLRGSGAGTVRLVEASTGRLLGTVDAARADACVHEGAVHVHQSDTYLVESLDLDDLVAHVRRAELDYTTVARSVTDLRVCDVRESRAWGAAALHLGVVEVDSRVTSYIRRAIPSGSIIDQTPLDLPVRTLTTSAVWWTIAGEDSGIDEAAVPGAVHAAEHASIGLLPLVATCDRWDIGGVSSAAHPDTGLITSFVYDGIPGGAGFAERGFRSARTWLTATYGAIASCSCETGCPSCVQSPKCGNGNEPLDKAAASTLLARVLRGAIDDRVGGSTDTPARESA